MNTGSLKALRGVMLAVAVLGTIALLWGFAQGGGSVFGLVTLIPLWLIAGFADWQLSGRWDGIFGAVFGARR
ncbi:hypothetical protein OCH239_07465 [Roseivivax halodurans JCM 10272]|uniref:Uncharacterized protein n=1 Tax=Roseivivax halodurans JCM 10272 TaxID=1449350 RepID=X7EM62_9RHOB|nr:hypothetical protein [Roseivivax halodurans]ETX16248.1 hypothetical protein OCH239_07465 [Roseivivax halodurans JCM 10272]